MYRKIPKSKLLETRGEWWFQELADHISKQAEKGAPCDFDYSVVNAMPKEVQAIFFVWWFSCEAGGSGFAGFLLQNVGLHAQEAHEGLRLIGADELVERLEAAIPFSFEWTPEFTRLEDYSWFKQFKPSVKYPTIESIDTLETYKLIGDDLRDRANTFINNHIEEFCE